MIICEYVLFFFIVFVSMFLIIVVIAGCASNKRIKYTYGDIQCRTVVAYNVGSAAQTDYDPCISANGENVCVTVDKGFKRCAANFVPFGTRLKIEGHGVYTVVDRVSRLNPEIVAIAMPSKALMKAKIFGVQELEVSIVK